MGYKCVYPGGCCRWLQRQCPFDARRGWGFKTPLWLRYLVAHGDHEKEVAPVKTSGPCCVRVGNTQSKYALRLDAVKGFLTRHRGNVGALTDTCHGFRGFQHAPRSSLWRSVTTTSLLHILESMIYFTNIIQPPFALSPVPATSYHTMKFTGLNGVITLPHRTSQIT